MSPLSPAARRPARAYRPEGRPMVVLVATRLSGSEEMKFARVNWVDISAAVSRSKWRETYVETSM